MAKSSKFTEALEVSLRKWFFDSYAATPGQGHAKSSHGINKKKRKMDWHSKDVRKATEKPNAKDKVQEIVDIEVKKLGGE